jgi:pre-mRNA-splicing factor ISY1
MFEAAKPKPKGKDGDARPEYYRKNLDASYYGYNLDEEDGTLLAFEAQRQEDAAANMAAKGEKLEGDWEPLPGDIGDGKEWALPSLEDVQQELMERRKRRLLDKLG